MHQAKGFANQLNISGFCFRNRAKSRKVLAVERKAFADSRKAWRGEPRMHLFSFTGKKVHSCAAHLQNQLAGLPGSATKKSTTTAC